MKSAVFAAAALVGTAVADSVGSAIVINKCDYDIYLYNTPSSDGGYSEVDKTLSSGSDYTQQWTELSNGNGWSIKLSNSTSLIDILQYEYTFQNDGTIWYDLSEVNGNPWDGNWEITADTSACAPKQQAYRYATDDAYGMQSCSQDASITVTLCSAESQDDGDASSASSSVAAETSVTSSSASSTAASTTSSVSAVSVASSTTLYTSVITAAAVATTTNNDVVVTVTEVATTTYWSHHWGGRDAHHHAARHPHGHN